MQARRFLSISMFACIDEGGVSIGGILFFLGGGNILLSDLRGPRGGHAYTPTRLRRQPTKQCISRALA